jgi:hypothetical protein
MRQQGMEARRIVAIEETKKGDGESPLVNDWLGFPQDK